MKQLHRNDLFCWSEFNPERNLDFHSILWVRQEGNVLIDPLPLSVHDLNHLRQLGGAATIIVTNSDHCRDAFHISKITGASLYGPAQEQKTFPLACQHWVHDKEEIVPGLIAYELNGSKSPGELALVLEQHTLITGDLIRSHKAGELCMLPESKLLDVFAAKESVRRMANLQAINTVLVGDGWPVFHHGRAVLNTLVNAL
ncbi:hypothetical protein MCAMS1_00106 [biofilm metagenome]